MFNIFKRKGFDMKPTKKFYKEHNISKDHFAKMIGISPATLKKYSDGGKVTDEKKNRIDVAVKTLNELGLVYPDLKCFPTEKGRADYLKNKKKSDSLDKKFEKAYKKALK